MAGTVQVQERDVRIEETIDQMESAALINYTAEYAQYVEFETAYDFEANGWPFPPLRDWVDRKWPDLSSGLKTDAQGNDLSVEAVTWKVLHILNEHGSDGVHFGQRGLDAAKQAAPAIEAQFEGSGDPKAGEKIVAEVAEVGFNKGQAVISQEATDTGTLLQSGSIELVDSPADLPAPARGGGSE
jgi:hypothetical protein